MTPIEELCERLQCISHTFDQDGWIAPGFMQVQRSCEIHHARETLRKYAGFIYPEDFLIHKGNAYGLVDGVLFSTAIRSHNRPDHEHWTEVLEIENDVKEVVLAKLAKLSR
jgi:hypothetical protein